MISLISTVIKEKLPELKDKKFSFMKYSTPTSGTNLSDKVLFFVFKNKESTPVLCVKTVRNYGARETIVRVFNNLKKMNELTLGSVHSRLFAEAKYLHDDGENIFSIESACPGNRVKLNLSTLSKIVSEYVNFQQYLAEKKESPLVSLEQFADDLVAKSGFKEKEKLEIKEFFLKLSGGGVKLPRLIQHGDVTEDNILLSKDGLYFLDCDLVGLVDIPGFDLFGLFYRYDPYSAKDLCYKYLPDYFAKIGVEMDAGDNNNDRLFFLYFLIESVIRKPYKLGSISVNGLISNFKKIIGITK